MKKKSRNDSSVDQIALKIILVLLIILAIPLTKTALDTFRNPEPKAAVLVAGNGSPVGTHYNLNLIGVPKTKTADMAGDNGRRIFVSLEGNTQIKLFEGADFAVLDANGTDGSASFQLPNPDPTNSGLTEYSVWARALGKPGGSSTTTTCATDELGQLWCSVYPMILVRSSGKSSFTNVSKQLLYVYADMDGNGVAERYPLFSTALSNYFWNYDNNGLKVAQLRFYPTVANVN